MKYKAMIPAVLMCAGLALSACQVQEAPLSQTGPAAAERSVPVPAKTAPASVPASTPSLTQPQPASVPRPAETARTVLERSAKAMAEAKSYDYTLENMTNLGGSEALTQTKATVFPFRGDGMTRTTQAGAETVSYLKNNRMYFMDPAAKIWVYVDLPPASPEANMKIHPRVDDYMKLEKKKDGGYVLSSKRPLSALEFYSLTGLEIREAQALKDMEAQGQTLETMAVLVLDDKFRYREVSYEQVIESGAMSTHSILNYTYSNYDQAAEITVPSEILENAVPAGSAGTP